MDNNIQPPASAENQGYQTFGKKVFWLFFLQISPIAFILLFVSIVLFVLSFQPFLVNGDITNGQSYALMSAFFAFILSLLSAIICCLVSWLTYKNYVFSMTDDSFKIRRGILSRTENAIPYRQIQDADIERSLFFRMLGLSRLVILTAGHEDEAPKGSDEAEGIIPAVDQKLAEWLQAELLRRANIQKTVQVTNQAPEPAEPGTTVKN